MTYYLYGKPSLIEGIGRNMDFFGLMNSYHHHAYEEDTDNIALTYDLLAIYNDFQKAYNNTLCQLKTTKIN